MKHVTHYHKEPIFVKTKLSSKDLDSIKVEVKKVLENSTDFQKWNSKLAGNIEKEYQSPKIIQEILNPYIQSSSEKFYLSSEEGGDVDKLRFAVVDQWINFQKKYEFNPMHDHSCNLSYVVWIQVPFDHEEEQNFSNCKDSNTKLNSMFSFSYLNIFGRITNMTLPVDKSWEGTMIMFPSSLNHQVYPFYTSDDYRISIAGNVNIEIKKSLEITY